MNADATRLSQRTRVRLRLRFLHWWPALLTAVVCLAATSLRADQVTMLNGDRYVGSVVSLNADALVLRSEVLGTVRLPRAQVAVITLGAQPQPIAPGLNTATNAAATPPSAAAADTNLLQQLQSQFLGEDGAAARQQFNSLLSGYLSGKLNVNDIRAQAQSAAEQIKKLKGELGSDASGALDTYLSVLQRFLAETPAAEAPAPGSPAQPAKPDSPAPEAP